MILILISLLLAWTPFAQELKDIGFDIRAKQNLLMGKGANTGRSYYDVVITKDPASGVFIKMPYTKKGGKFSFDLHHRIAMTEEFGLPAEVTTVVEILSGGTTSIGVYTIADKINSGDKFDEPINKTSSAEIDKYVTPLSRKTITLDIRPGPQSISIVGQMLSISRGSTTTRIDTPGTRIATASNFKFQEVSPGESLR
ncbi:MAG: hypothetical protein DMG14_02510 [Acidobacteria bacterium]|nr:MAG: hypothetical protein DMG14_02510 [Acidobacteriota bacterium]